MNAVKAASPERRHFPGSVRTPSNGQNNRSILHSEPIVKKSISRSNKPTDPPCETHFPTSEHYR